MKRDARLCRRVQQDLLLFLDGDLPGKDAARIQDHLAACPACRAEMEAIARLWQVDAARFEPSSEVWMGLRAQIERKRSIWVRWRRELRGAVVPAFRLAGVVAAVWMGIFLGTQSDVSRDGQEPAREFDRVFYLDVFDISPPGSISQVYVESSVKSP